jgi:hypothetical protein
MKCGEDLEGFSNYETHSIYQEIESDDSRDHWATLAGQIIEHYPPDKHLDQMAYMLDDYYTRLNLRTNRFLTNNLNFEIIINQFLGKVNWPEIADYLLQVAED